MKAIRTVGGALFKYNKLLVIKRSIRMDKWPGLWEIPRVHVEKNETLRETLKREFFEETGLKIKVSKKYRESSFQFGHEYVDESSFIVKADNFKVKISPRECSKFRWITKEEAEKLNMADEMHENIRKAFKVAGT
ncbi:NUDIX hydrolase [archaeon]|nr:NUDIX hydrolase [archaeon]